MNILALPQIAALLGGGINPNAPQYNPQSGDPSASPTATPSPVTPAMSLLQGVPPASAVNSMANSSQAVGPTVDPNSPVSKYRTGILAGKSGHSGPFRPGSLGGNILGALGDAFLVANGAQPVYAPRLKMMREAEALQGYDKDPYGAISRVTDIDPATGIKLRGDQQDYDAKAASQALLKRKMDYDYQSGIESDAKSLLATANEKNYPALKALVERRLAAAGIAPSFGSLPATYDKDAIDSIVNSDLSVKDRATLEAREAYQNATLGYKRDALAEKTENDRGNRNINKGKLSNSERRTDIYGNKVQGDYATGQYNAQTRRMSVNKAPDRSKWTQPTGRGTNGKVSGFNTIVDPTTGRTRMVPIIK